MRALRYTGAMDSRSFRRRLRAFQDIHRGTPDPGFVADLEFLENRDLDLSVRLGAMLAFNALLITIGTHPVSASPGAPLSLDAATRPAQTIASLAAIVPFVVASYLCLAALLIGEDFDPDRGDPDALRRSLLAAFVRSIDAQGRRLITAIHATLTGGVATLAVWAWIIGEKIAG